MGRCCPPPARRMIEPSTSALVGSSNTQLNGTNRELLINLRELCAIHHVERVRKVHLKHDLARIFSNSFASLLAACTEASAPPGVATLKGTKDDLGVLRGCFTTTFRHSRRIVSPMAIGGRPPPTFTKAAPQ